MEVYTKDRMAFYPSTFFLMPVWTVDIMTTLIRLI